jgi:hypothetical protein
MTRLALDLRFGFRPLLRNRRFTLPAIAALAHRRDQRRIQRDQWRLLDADGEHCFGRRWAAERESCVLTGD